jgi:PAS domain S-box-containing protein
MTGTRTYKRRSEAAERQRVLRITRKVSATLGNDFFQSLVKQMADALGADCVYVGELIQGPIRLLRTLAVRQEGQWAENFDQELSNTASAQVLEQGNFVCPLDVAELFPLDLVLERLHAQAFVGYRLCDSAGQVLGVLAAVYGQRLSDAEVARSVLETFTPRAATELERKCDYEALRRANERHRAFVASSMDAMWRIEFEKPIPVDLDEGEQLERIYRYGYMAECNEAFAKLAGAQSAEELVGARFEALVPRNDSRLTEELRSAIRSGYRTAVVETTPLDELGRRMYRLRSEFGIVENGELLRMWGTIRDITGLKRAELALDASERRYREMLERLQLPAVVVDPAGHVQFANDALLGLGRWPKPELASRNWFDVLAGQESRNSWKTALAYTGSGPTFAHFDGPILSAEGIPRLVSWDSTLLLNADGGVEGIAAIGTDITSQKAVEAQIRRAQKLEGIERMAAGVAHDLNNLLMVVLYHTSQSLSETEASDPMRVNISAIRASAMQCVGLTEELLAIARKQRLAPVILNLNSIIIGAEPVIRGLLGQKISLDLQLDPKLLSVNADPVQLERVLTNLAINARDAMANGGRLSIATGNAGATEIPVSGMAGVEPGPYVRLTVTDTGIGMSEEVQARIFDPFFTTKPPGSGTGLGLATVYGIVAQSGGFISVYSRPGEGASFAILLPAAGAA